MPGIASAYGLIFIGSLALIGGGATGDIPLVEVGTFLCFAGAALAMTLPALHRWARRRAERRQLAVYQSIAARRRGITRN